MSLLQSNAISSSAVLAALCRCLQWPSALRALRLRSLDGVDGVDAVLGSCELADAPAPARRPVTLNHNPRIPENPA